MKQSPNLKRGIIQIPKGLFRPLNTKRLLSALCLLLSTRSNTGANYLRLPHQRWVSLLHKTWTPQWKRWQSRRTCWWRSWCSRQWQNLCTGETKHKAAIVTPISLPYQPVTHCREACWAGGEGLLDSHFASGGIARRRNTFILTPLSLKWQRASAASQHLEHISSHFPRWHRGHALFLRVLQSHYFEPVGLDECSTCHICNKQCTPQSPAAERANLGENIQKCRQREAEPRPELPLSGSVLAERYYDRKGYRI